MSSNLLNILQELTRPKSAEEVRTFLIERHGATARDNASSDVSALDNVATKALVVKGQLTKGLIHEAIVEEVPTKGSSSKGYREQVKAIRAIQKRSAAKRGELAIENLRNRRKVKL